MIKLLPSSRVKKLTGLDFKLLEWIIDRVVCENIGKELRYNITIHKSRVKDTSYVVLENRSRDFIIQLDCDSGMRYTIESILHEIRHIIQHTHFKTPVGTAFKSYRQYYVSQEERDARQFEKLATPVIHMYKAFEKSKAVFKKHNLGTPIK